MLKMKKRKFVIIVGIILLCAPITWWWLSWRRVIEYCVPAWYEISGDSFDPMLIWNKLHDETEWDSVVNKEKRMPYFSLDGGGRDIICSALDWVEKHRGDNEVFVVEVGVFMGGSIDQWAKCTTVSKIIGINGRNALGSSSNIVKYWTTQAPLSLPPEYTKMLEDDTRWQVSLEEHGTSNMILSNLYDHRDRVSLLYASAPASFKIIANLPVRVVYVDSDKTYDEMWGAALLWPNAILCGDDYTSIIKDDRITVLKRVAQKLSFAIVHKSATFLLLKTDHPHLAEILKIRGVMIERDSYRALHDKGILEKLPGERFSEN